MLIHEYFLVFDSWERKNHDGLIRGFLELSEDRSSEAEDILMKRNAGGGRWNNPEYDRVVLFF